MKEHDLPDTDDLSCKIQVLDEHYIKFYSHHILEVQITDTCMMTCNHAHTFKSIDLSDYDLILDYSWLQVINSDVDWAIKKWRYCDVNKTELIEILDTEACANKIQKSCAVFILTSYHIIADELVTLFRFTVNKSCLSVHLKEFVNVFLKKKTVALSDHV